MLPLSTRFFFAHPDASDYRPLRILKQRRTVDRFLYEVCHPDAQCRGGDSSCMVGGALWARSRTDAMRPSPPHATAHSSIQADSTVASKPTAQQHPSRRPQSRMHVQLGHVQGCCADACPGQVLWERTGEAPFDTSEVLAGVSSSRDIRSISSADSSSAECVLDDIEGGESAELKTEEGADFVEGCPAFEALLAE